MVDEELFFARRLGYGLKHGESIGSNVRDWAIGQITNIPELSFYGEDGTNIQKLLPTYAKPIIDYGEATHMMGVYWDKERILLQSQAKADREEWIRQMDYEMHRPRAVYPQWREALARSLTAVNGPSPVFERFWAFWVNHFAVNAEDVTKLLYGPHTRTIRSHMTGKFQDMLQDAILQPAMVYYLDNFLSAGPNSSLGRSGDTINENLARELLELHTMSPAGGYTQDDVLETAYALSGWGFYSGKSDEEPKKNKKTPFGRMFDLRRHEPGTRRILGKTYGKANKGKDQAPELMADLAVHPATAHFLAFKLARHFIADEPPEDSVTRIQEAWLGSGGDLVTVHTAVIDEVLTKALGTVKFSTPIQWLHHLHRTSGIPVPRASPYQGDYWISVLLEELGQGFDIPLQPNGYSDLEADWISKQLLERRVRYAGVTAFKAKPAMHEYLMDYAVRLTGEKSELVVAMQGSGVPMAATTILLSSPQFMRI